MIFKLQTKLPLPQIEQGLQDSAARHKFGVIAVHNLQEMLKNKGAELAMECRVYEVCNPFQAKKVLDAEGAISTMLPCRISVYGSEAAGYTLATMRPTEMMRVFDLRGIEPVAREVESVIFQMMRDAAGTPAA